MTLPVLLKLCVDATESKVYDFLSSVLMGGCDELLSQSA